MFSQENGKRRGPHGGRDDSTSTEADSTLPLARDGEARSPDVGDGGAEGSGDVQESRSPTAPFSLVKTARVSTRRKEWSKQQKRAYQALMTCLDYWGANGFQVVWVHLTTAPDGDAGRLAYHHKRLRQSVETKRGYDGLQFVEVITREGHGVIHTLWAWRPQQWGQGRKPRSFYVPQRWLSEAWGRIHGAKVVWIEKVRMDESGRLASYMAGQYMAGQEAVVRITASWRRTLGISGVCLWRWWRAHYRETERKEALRTWKELLRSGKAVLRNVGEVSLLSIRAKARAWLKVEEAASENGHSRSQR